MSTFYSLFYCLIIISVKIFSLGLYKFLVAEIQARLALLLCQKG